MKQILIILASNQGVPDNTLSMIRSRVEHLKAKIYGHNVISFNLSVEVDEEEQMDLMRAVEYSDEVVVFDHQLDSPEIMPLISERIRNGGSLIFFGEEDNDKIKDITDEYKNTKCTEYPNVMIEMMGIETTPV